MRQMEQLIHLLPESDYRHYFQGYTYLYKSFGSVLDVSTEKDKTYLDLARSTFELAALEAADDHSTSIDAMWTDLLFIRASVKKVGIENISIEGTFSEMTNMRFNMETANTCFRLLLVYFYWGIGIACDKTPPISFAETAYRAYKKTTAYRGYRAGLLEASYNHLNMGMLEHCEQETDYPLVECMEATSEELKHAVAQYWKTETGELMLVKGTLGTCEQLLFNSHECQELYAFGAQIITELIL